MATTSRLKTMDDCLDRQEQTIQQVQGKVLHMREDVQAVFGQLNELSFKFLMLMADWQQQKGQGSVSSMG